MLKQYTHIKSFKSYFNQVIPCQNFVFQADPDETFYFQWYVQFPQFFNCGITAVLLFINISFRSDRHPEESKNRYYGYLGYIIECDFGSFKLVLFDIKWCRLRMNECDIERNIIEHNNVFSIVNTRMVEPGKKYLCSFKPM